MVWLSKVGSYLGGLSKTLSLHIAEWYVQTQSVDKIRLRSSGMNYYANYTVH